MLAPEKMFQVDKEIIEIIESFPEKPKTNYIDYKSIIIDCPICKARIRIMIYHPDFIKNVENSQNGLLNVNIYLPCEHDVIFNIDKEMKIRGWMEVCTKIQVFAEKLDVKYLREMKIKLLECHKELSKDSKNDAKAFKVFQELKRIEKEIKNVT